MYVCYLLFAINNNNNNNNFTKSDRPNLWADQTIIDVYSLNKTTNSSNNYEKKNTHTRHTDSPLTADHRKQTLKAISIKLKYP